MITLTYLGKRINGDSLTHYYLEGDGKHWIFKKPINGDYRIGQKTECEQTPTGVKGPYNRAGFATKEQIGQWSIEERADILKLQEEKDKKKDPEGHVDELIKLIKRNTPNSVARRRLAQYIYNQLV